jgi:uncharacterized membrane protein YdjX (TVP38/TMEM64 family)
MTHASGSLARDVPVGIGISRGPMVMNFVSQTWHRVVRNRRDARWLVAIVVVVIAALLLTHGWWDEVKFALERTHPAWFFALLCVLPLGGMSIALMYVVVGARFGGPTGIAIVAVATWVHLIGSHLIARSVLRRPVERMLRRRDLHLPELSRSEPVAVALLGALVPGIPYVARNYLMALSDVPFRIYAPICWLVYVVRSGVAIFLGDWAEDLTPTRIAILVAVFLLKFGACAGIVWHLYRKHGRSSHDASVPPKRQPRPA